MKKLNEYSFDLTKMLETQSLAFEGIQRVSSHFSEGGSLGMTGLWEIINNRQANALENLLKRPWFMRVWVIQEVAFARQASIVSGDELMALGPFLENLGCHEALKRQFYSSISPFRRYFRPTKQCLLTTEQE